jgi:hypothetical protein
MTSDVAIPAAKLATAGLRLHQRQARPTWVIALAWIGSPARNRLNSFERSLADSYRLGGSFSNRGPPYGPTIACTFRSDFLKPQNTRPILLLAIIDVVVSRTVLK